MMFNTPYFMQNAAVILRAMGRRLRDRRISADLTQGQLAMRVGVSRQTVTRMESGENISVDSLVRLAMALDAAAEFNALFPPVDTRSLDEILAQQRKPQRVRHSAGRKAESP